MSKQEVTEDWWWIDYLENEMDPSLEQDLQMLLDGSQEDRDAFESYRVLKEWLLGSDPIADWPLESRLRSVRRKVMEAIETIEPVAVADEYHVPAVNAAGKSLRV